MHFGRRSVVTKGVCVLHFILAYSPAFPLISLFFQPIWALQDDIATWNYFLDLTLAFLKDKRFLSFEV